jgi:hypothetical protein
MKKKINFMIFFLFIVLKVHSQEIQNFNTPYAVIEYFVDNIKTGNFDNVLFTSPYNYDSLIKRINPGEVINYMGWNLAQLRANIPLQYHSIIKLDLLGLFAIEIKYFIFNLLLSEEYPDFAVNLKPFSVNDSILDNYFSLMDVKNLETLELINIDIYKPDIQFSERGKNNTLRQYLKPYGCDEKIEYTVLYKHNGNFYVGGVTVVRYDSNYYIESLSGSYSGIGRGSLIKVPGIFDYNKEYK